jgi:hypothetical protein
MEVTILANTRRSRSQNVSVSTLSGATMPVVVGVVIGGSVMSRLVDGDDPILTGSLLAFTNTAGMVDDTSTTDIVGLVVGTDDGIEDGMLDGTEEGIVDGDSDGTADGTKDGTLDDTLDGTDDGTEDGATDGESDGAADGTVDGTEEGIVDGIEDGIEDGTADGAFDGTSELKSDLMTDDASDGIVDGTVDSMEDGTVDGANDPKLDCTSDGTSERIDDGTDERSSDGASERIVDGTNDSSSLLISPRTSSTIFCTVFFRTVTNIWITIVQTSFSSNRALKLSTNFCVNTKDVALVHSVLGLELGVKLGISLAAIASVSPPRLPIPFRLFILPAFTGDFVGLLDGVAEGDAVGMLVTFFPFTICPISLVFVGAATATGAACGARDHAFSHPQATRKAEKSNNEHACCGTSNNTSAASCTCPQEMESPISRNAGNGTFVLGRVMDDKPPSEHT